MTTYLVSKTTKEHFLARNFCAADANDEDLILVKGDAEGWIEWSGRGECPLPGNQRCEVKLGYAKKISQEGAMPASRWHWTRGSLSRAADIFAYRPILDDKPQAPEDCVTVRYDLDPVSVVQSALRDRLIKMGWTPPKSEREKWVEAAEPLLRVGNTKTVLGRVYDALKSGELPNPTRQTGGDA